MNTGTVILTAAGSLVALTGGVFGVVQVADSRYAYAAEFKQHLAEERARTAQGLMESIAGEPAGAYRQTLCRTLEQTLAGICMDSPEHPFCEDRQVLMVKAGC